MRSKLREVQSHESTKSSEMSCTVHQIQTGMVHEGEGVEDGRTRKGAGPQRTLSLVK